MGLDPGQETKQPRRIERAATSAVRDVLNGCRHLEYEIYELDKNIIWDGYITLYRNESFSRESHVGRVPIQVKGTTLLKRINGGAAYYEEIDVLQSFLDDGGILYFVGDVDDEYKCKQLFYAVLMPHDLFRIIDTANTKKQKGASFPLQIFPNEELEVERIVRQFLDEKKRQGVIIERGPVSWEELETKGVPIESCSVHLAIYGNESPRDFERLLKNQYLYVNTKYGDSYPLEKIADAKIIPRRQSVQISSGNSVIVAKPEFLDDGTVSVGGINFSFGEQGYFTYREQGTFSERLSFWKLMREILRTREIYINGSYLATIGSPPEDSLVLVDEKIEQYGLCCELRDVLHIPLDWDPESLSEDDITCLSILISGFAIKKTMHSDSAVPGFRNFRIGEGLVKVFVQSVEGGGFHFVDPLSPQCVFVPSRDGTIENVETDSALPVLMLFAKDDFRIAINLSHELLGESFSRCVPTEHSKDIATNGLLNMLSAWDAGAILQDELYKCCEVTAAWLDSEGHSGPISRINSIQVARRVRELSAEEQSELENLIADNQGNGKLIASAEILLGHYSMAEVFIRGMEDAEQNEFRSWPIYNLVPESEHKHV